MPHHAIDKIKLLAMDVDGVLTDGGVILHDDGSESKKFHVRDGAWIRIWQRQGFRTAIITGRYCRAVEHRAKQLEIDFLYQNAHRKAETLEQLVKDARVGLDEIAFIGDDVMDIPVMRRVGYSAAVADAHSFVRQAAATVTQAQGGHGAVCEFIEVMLKQKGLLQQAMERYYL